MITFARRLVASVAALLLIIAGSAPAADSSAETARLYCGHYTQERIANLRRNCERFDWARAQRDKAVADAAYWLAKSDDELWAMVPGQDLPRCIDTTLDTKADGPKRLGCLKCGNKIFNFGNYPYDPDFDHKPWKLTCPSCGAVFPTNDFGKYYASGIDEHGVFNPKKADRSLLFNAEHPDPKDPLHLFGVDDGYGYVDANGRSHRFIGYYTWKYWMHIQDGLRALANAYLYTGDIRYSHKAAILLDRIADIYPSMDWKPYSSLGWFHSDGGTGEGKIEGRIWETGVVNLFADSIDKVLSGTVDDPALYDFLKKQSQRYQLPHPKGTREQFVRNIDDGILRCAYDAIRKGQVAGNEGMHQKALTACALALNTQPETNRWLDWLFAPDQGAVPGLIVGQFDRDGVSPEGAPGYALSWGQNIAQLAAMLADYPAYKAYDIYHDFPQFRATFTAAWRMAVLGKYTPNLGDSGSTGALGAAGLNTDFMAEGYRHTQDPEIAIAAFRANHDSATGLGRDIFSADPDALGKEIAAVAAKAGPRPIGSTLMSGFGLGTLESPAAGGTAVAFNFGRTTHHAHADRLNFDLLAFGHWLAPDLGYPEFATSWPSRNEWNNITLSHNTVVVDQSPQQSDWGGHVRLFSHLPDISAVQVSSPDVYPQTCEYARTLLLIDAPANQTYVVDFFQVMGGHDHLYSFHGLPGTVTVSGIELAEQKDGTYAGPKIPFGAHARNFPLGYSWLYDVRRTTATPPDHFMLDWSAAPGYRGVAPKDDIHLRLHAFTPCTDVALADGDPPQNKPGNPRRITYALLHRTGKDGLSSTFCSVFEPYQGTPFIRGVARLPAPGQAVALRVELEGGSVDHIIFNPDGGQVSVDGVSCTGTLGFIRETAGVPVKAVLVGGSELAYSGVKLAGTPALTGKVVRMNRELAGGGWILVDTPLPTDGSLIGRQIMIVNDNERDACYTIRNVTREGGQTRVDCGPISFVRGYAGPTMELRHQTVARRYDQGYLYDFAEGAPFRITGEATWSR